MSTVDVPTRTTLPTTPLRRLYAARAVFAFLWAGAFAAVASPFGTAALVLAVLYAAVDAAATLVDAATPGDRPSRLLQVNVAVSTVTAVALAAVGTGDRGDVLLVWGLWALVAGALQLGTGLARRRRLGGQGAVVLSGGLSVLAGAGFAASSRHGSLVGIAGYAALGGVFFLVSALRQGRGARG
ncbi:hypothetical protein G5V58_17210 [Nocardioides anomalus]|uniref:Integral membrane protein n=1 Tax=Nocardioides anomalus TaxID=2712223 RepID=A0A6G6WG08_9ACTN|nr:hypothetical protein [Nocardioides anomalus]QIG44281.1 hypothetical protein G5V58_17210 [Nocardioides anomalus]